MAKTVAGARAWEVARLVAKKRQAPPVVTIQVIQSVSNLAPEDISRQKSKTHGPRDGKAGA